jgi:hypothetical protein
MVTRQKKDRRKLQVRQSICKTCMSLMAALAIVLGPLMWERIASIASYLLNPSPTWGG